MDKKTFYTAGLVTLSLLGAGAFFTEHAHGSASRDPAVIRAEIATIPSIRPNHARIRALENELAIAEGRSTSSSSPAPVSNVPRSQSSTVSPPPPPPPAPGGPGMPPPIARGGSIPSPHPALGGSGMPPPIARGGAAPGGYGVAPLPLPGVGEPHALRPVQGGTRISSEPEERRHNEDVEYPGIIFPDACALAQVEGVKEDASRIYPQNPGAFVILHGIIQKSPLSAASGRFGVVFKTTELLGVGAKAYEQTYQITPHVGEIGVGRVDGNRMEFLLSPTLPGKTVLAVVETTGNFVKCIRAPEGAIIHGKKLSAEDQAHNDEIGRQINEAAGRGEDVSHLIAQIRQ